MTKFSALILFVAVASAAPAFAQIGQNFDSEPVGTRPNPWTTVFGIGFPVANAISLTSRASA